MLEIGKYSFGTGDRFARQGEAQLRATLLAERAGVRLTHVWNKSFREHKTVKSDPSSVRAEAEAAVTALGWNGQYLVDADHINLNNVESFLPHSDFFTIDVAEYIGTSADGPSTERFLKAFSAQLGEIRIPGIAEPFEADYAWLEDFAARFLGAINAAGTIYAHISRHKGPGSFVTEVSMDEVDEPQTPAELHFILGGLAWAGVPVQTIAPRFSGRFNKGVDYVGDVDRFSREFEDDLLVVRAAAATFGLPAGLKLSLHSGSDKFSIYAPIRSLLHRHHAGLHVKTAGTTWLEELGGIALGGGSGLELARHIYAGALERFEELTGPYRTVIDIRRDALPTVAEVREWPPERFASTLQHDVHNGHYDPQFRQLMHCAYKLAAEEGQAFYRELENNRRIIAEKVTHNLFEQHIRPIFIG
jgi:tagaturonate epimerase